MIAVCSRYTLNSGRTLQRRMMPRSRVGSGGPPSGQILWAIVPAVRFHHLCWSSKVGRYIDWKWSRLRMGSLFLAVVW